METPTNCGLCEEALGERGHDRVGGLALCRRCFHGDVERVVAARGWTLWSTHEEYRDYHDEVSRIEYRTEVRIVLACEAGVHMVCERWTVLRWLLGLVRRRARSRDSLFEGHVRVWTETPSQVEQLLRVDGVEGCVMEVLGNLGESRVEVSGGALRIFYVSDDPHTEGELVARACALAHRLEASVGRQKVAAAKAEERSVYGARRR